MLNNFIHIHALPILQKKSFITALGMVWMFSKFNDYILCASTAHLVNNTITRKPISFTFTEMRQA